MTVRQIELHRRRINATFARTEQLNTIDGVEEMKADYARFLCVLISGWLERSIANVIMAYVEGKCARPIQSYMENSLRKLSNVDSERLLRAMGHFDKLWRDQLEQLLTDEQVSALNSVVGLRNDIAHGGGGSLSLQQVSVYWSAVQSAVEQFETILLDANSARRNAASTPRSRR